ncbi:MAG: FAD-dependent oxidoreductase [Peptococcaceae bacterium]|nr:FAD-dependent oxidoreductase [Peptococcaceae bacterium]
MKKKRLSLLSMLLIVSLLVTGCVGGSENTDTKAVAEELPIFENEGKAATDYDVIVVGSDPEGISAAISAARSGMKVLLLSKDSTPGGLYTLGALNFIDIPETRDGKTLVGGIYEEFFNKVGGSGFDIVEAANVFDDMLKSEDNITVRYNSKFVEPVMDDDTITGVVVDEDGQEITYSAPYVIDATQDGDVAAAAGAPYTFAGEDIGERDREMGVTLVFRLSGVDWDKMTRYLTVKRAIGEFFNKSTSMGVSGNTAWGFSDEGYGYEPEDEAMRLRGFNMARQDNGDILVNALLIFDVDVLDEESRAEGIARAKAELENIVPYLQKNCKGFKNCELAGTAEDLYVRESRHIDCEYNLTIDDLLENRDQEDRIAVSSYPVDVQPTKTQTYGTVVGYPDQYAIGYKSLVPKDVEGLLIVGRAAGYTSLAAGSARIVPTGMACGEAAGVAVAVAKSLDKTPREMVDDSASMALIQDLLKDQGAKLDHTQTKEDVMSHWAYPGVKVLRSLGVLDGGYDNDYALDDDVTMNRYQNMVNNAVKKAGFELSEKIYVNENPPARQIIGTMARACVEIEGGDKLENDNDVYLKALEERGIMTDEIKKYFSDMEAVPKASAVTMLTARFYSYLLTLDGAQSLKAAECIDLESEDNEVVAVPDWVAAHQDAQSDSSDTAETAENTSSTEDAQTDSAA